MPKSDKKCTIIHILRILYNYTDPQHPVTQTAIVKYLSDLEIDCSRKTVGRNLKYLSDMGLPICRVEKNKGGYYYDITADTFFLRGR